MQKNQIQKALDRMVCSLLNALRPSMVAKSMLGNIKRAKVMTSIYNIIGFRNVSRITRNVAAPLFLII